MTDQWIPVSERLPEEDGAYLVTTDYGKLRKLVEIVSYANDLYSIDDYDFHDKEGIGGWYNYDAEYGYVACKSVIAWMPLPKPYEPQESEDKE